MAVDNQKLAVSGAIAGGLTPFILQWAVLPVLNFLGGFVPQANLKLAEASEETIAVNVRESLTGFEALGGWFLDALGITTSNGMGMLVVLGAIGGALLFVSGAWLADKAGFLKGSAMDKIRNTIIAGSIIAAIVMGTIALPPELGITLANVVIAFGVNAAILAWAYTWLDKRMDIGLNPF